MKKEEKIELFEQTPVAQACIKLALPTVIGCLVMILYNLADTYFVGKINDSVQSSAVTLAAPVILAFNAVNNLFGVGGSSMMSRALGGKDYDLVKKSSAFSFYGAILCGMVFSLAMTVFQAPMLGILGADDMTRTATSQYMFWTVTLGAIPSILNVVMGNLVRAEGSALHATIGTMSGCLLNIVLDPIFILPQMLDMGAAGAGLATFISNSVACLYFFCFLWFKRSNTYVCISPRYFCLARAVLVGVCSVGIPASIQNLLNVTGMTILNNFMSEFGSKATAAIGIAHKTTMIPMYVSMGISQGVMPLIGYNYAAKNGKRVKEAILFTMKIGGGFMIAATALYFFFAPTIMKAFMKDTMVVAYGSAFMKGLCLAQPFLAMDFLAVGVFQACGMGKSSLYFSICRKVVLEIPALFLLNYLFPMYGLAYAQLVAEVVLAIAAMICIRRIFKEVDEGAKIKN